MIGAIAGFTCWWQQQYFGSPQAEIYVSGGDCSITHFWRKGKCVDYKWWNLLCKNYISDADQVCLQVVPWLVVSLLIVFCIYAGMVILNVITICPTQTLETVSYMFVNQMCVWQCCWLSNHSGANWRSTSHQQMWQWTPTCSKYHVGCLYFTPDQWLA